MSTGSNSNPASKAPSSTPNPNGRPRSVALAAAVAAADPKQSKITFTATSGEHSVQVQVPDPSQKGNVIIGGQAFVLNIGSPGSQTTLNLGLARPEMTTGQEAAGNGAKGGEKKRAQDDEDGDEPKPKKRRATLSEKDVAALKALAAEIPVHTVGSFKGQPNLTEIQKQFHEKGYPFLARATIKGKLTEKAKRSEELPGPGRPRWRGFEAALLGNLVLAAIPSEKSGGKTQDKVNIAFNYEIIKTVGNQTLREYVAAKKEGYEAILSVKGNDLTLSNAWVARFLKHNKMHRRRFTSKGLVLAPSLEVIQQRMDEIAAEIETADKKTTQFKGRPAIGVNADETRVTYNPAPSHVYTSEPGRAVGFEDGKEGFTAMLTVSRSGAVFPPFSVIKSSAGASTNTRGDMTKQRVLQNFIKDLDLKEQKNWTIDTYTKSLPLPVKENNKIVVKEVMIKRPFAFNFVNGHIVTVQAKGWADSVTTVMWEELVLDQVSKAADAPVLLVWDNCAAHNTPSVKKFAEDAGITLLPLPPNTTCLTQVCDLTLNGPLKAHLRQDRAEMIVAEARIWQRSAAEAAKEGKAIPRFKSTPPTIADGLTVLTEIIEDKLATKEMAEGLRNTWIRVGLVPDPAYGDKRWRLTKSGFKPTCDGYAMGDKVVLKTTEPTPELLVEDLGGAGTEIVSRSEEELRGAPVEDYEEGSSEDEGEVEPPTLDPKPEPEVYEEVISDSKPMAYKPETEKSLQAFWMRFVADKKDLLY
jgi:hypothetical protein